MMDKSAVLWVGLSSLFLCVFCPPQSYAEFYKYVDETGQTIFVDDPSKIPPAHREEVKSYRQKYDHLSEEERAIMLEKDRKELEAFRKEEIARARTYVGRETRVIVRGNQVLVPVLLGYEKREVEALLMLDTGASFIALHRGVADGLKMEDFQKGQARLAGGEIIDTDVARLSYVKVGPHRKEDLIAGIIDYQGPTAGFDGLLGMNFLRGLEYNIDFKNQRIVWKR
jgi:predicted aspartyl protease